MTRVRSCKHARPRLSELLLDKPCPLSAPVEVFYEELREPGYVSRMIRREDDDQYIAVQIDAVDLERKGKLALQIFLGFLAFLALAGMVGGMDRETRRQEFQARAER